MYTCGSVWNGLLCYRFMVPFLDLSPGFLLVSQWVGNVFIKVTEFIQFTSSCSRSLFRWVTISQFWPNFAISTTTQNVSGAQRAQLKSYSSFHTHCFSIYLKNQMAKTVTCSSSYRDPLCWETQYIKETQKTCWTVRPMIHLWDPWDLTLPTNILPHRERVLKWQSWLYCVCGREGYHHWVLSLWRKIVPPLCHFVDNALRYITTTAVTFLHIEFYVLGLFTLKFHLGMGCQTRCSQNADIGIKGGFAQPDDLSDIDIWISMSII